MRSFVRAIGLAAMATFAIVAHAQNDLTNGVDRNSGVTFKDTGYRPVPLAEGPFQPLSARNSLPPIVARSDSLEKRQSSCPVGYGDCKNGKCCPSNQLCSVAAGGCCPSNLGYTCGGQYCCPYSYCTADGHCGCSSASETRCGNKCCYYGCDASGGCACPSAYPNACSDGKTCCPAGAVCVAGGKCSGGGGGGGTFPTRPSLTSAAPQPTTGSGGSGTGGSGTGGSGSGTGGSGSGGSGSGGPSSVELPSGGVREYTAGAVAAFMGMAAVFAAV
ncbi:hypothetical protein EC968_007526 [Mortierella alpina]|nr:hypothetical protein EC968_007526 [Mortierella alpina]